MKTTKNRRNTESILFIFPELGGPPAPGSACQASCPTAAAASVAEAAPPAPPLQPAAVVAESARAAAMAAAVLAGGAAASQTRGLAAMAAFPAASGP